MTTANDISVPGLNGIRSWEGRALRAYRDEVGVWTVGYGLTNFDKGIPWKVQAGLTITADEAEFHLLDSLRRNYLPAVREVVPAGLPHDQAAFDAGASFHYNCGGIRKATWPKALARGDWAGAEQSLKSWNKGGGRVISGLVRRRAWEWGVIRNADYGAEGRSGPAILDERERTVGHAGPLTALPGSGAPTPAEPPKPPTGDASRPAGPSTAPAPVPTQPAPVPVEAPGVLRVGSTGPAVEALQRALAGLGYLCPISGTFDAATEDAVRNYQEHHPHLTADGKVGPATRAQIAREQDMRRKAKDVATKAGPVIIGGGAAWKGLGLSLGAKIAIVAGVGTLIVIALLAWQYRAEISRRVNASIGRVTP